MRSIRDIYFLSVEYLQKKGVVNAKKSVETILAKVFKYKNLDVYLNFEKLINEEELSKIRFFLKKRAKKEPLEYIFSSVSFYNLFFYLTKDVLIPRVETEILVDYICKEYKKEKEEEKEKKVLWDIGTGSGIIAISLKKNLPTFFISASDISKKALLVAKKNSIDNRVDITFKEGDLFQPFKGEKADIIVCNPPYISEKEYNLLDSDVKDFEPKIALVGGEKGWEFYEEISKNVDCYLNKGGKLFLEIGKDQKEILLEKFFLQKFWVSKKILKDYAGHDRFFLLEKE